MKADTNGHDRTEELLARLLLSRDQVAEILGVPVKTVSYLHRMHKLRAVKLGKSCMWKTEAVRDFVQELRSEGD